MSLLKIRQFSIDQSDTFTFANANVTGNLNSGNANLGNLVIANFFSGNGNALFSIQGANVVGTVGNATLATNVTASAQGNITSVGSLIGLTVSNASGIVDFTTTANVTLGAVANLHISGGTSGQVLRTDGSGALSWYTPSAGVVGSNTQVQFNDAGSAGASANLTFDKTSNTLTVTNITANGAGLTSITGANVTGEVSFAATANSVAGANVTGTVANATYAVTAGTAYSVAGANVTGTVANATYAVTAGTAYSVAGSNVSGQVGNSLVAGTVYTNAQPNITSVGTLTSLDITGNITSGNANLGNLVVANFFSGNGSLLTAITGANVTGTVANATYALNAGNAYSVAGANVTGTVANATYAVTAGTAYAVDGANVTGTVANATYAVTAGTAYAVDGANVTGTVANATYAVTAGTAYSVAGANVTGTVANATYAVTAGTAYSVTGSNVSGQVGNALVAGTVYTNAQPNITSVGTLTSLSVTGDIGAANLTLTGNLIISGTTTSVNSTVTSVVDPIFELGGGANGASLTTDDNKDRGVLLHYYSGSSTVDAFMGWDDSNGEFGVGSNVTITNEVVTWNSYGNIRANVYFGNGSQLTGVSATTATTAAKTANGTSNVDIATASGNITMAVGGTSGVVTITTTGVNIAGYANLGSGDLTSTGNVTVGYVIANGSGLTSLTGANVTGTVANATYALNAGNAYSVTGANVTGTVANATYALNAGNAYSVTGANVTGTVANATYALNAGTAYAVDGANVTGTVANATYALNAGNAYSVTGSNVSGQVGNALVAGTVYTNAQPNITSVGTLSGLTSTGIIDLTSTSNVSLGAVGNLHISGGSADYYLKTDGSGGLSFASLPSTTLTVDSFTGDGSWTMKTLTVTPASSSYTLVAIGGVFQPRTAYSLSGAVITFSDPPPNGAIVEITTIIGGTAGTGGGGGTSWTYSAVSANTTAVAGYRYIVDTSTANLTITLPASATLGDEVMIIDGTGNASTHEITVDKNGSKIQGANSNMTVTTDRAAFTLVYYNSTQGWILTNV